MRCREPVEGQQVRLGLQQQPGHLGHPALQVRHRLTQQPPGVLEVGGPEDRPDRRPDQLLQILGAVAEGITEEVDGAALPGSAQHLGDRGLEALVGVGDHQLDSR